MTTHETHWDPAVRALVERAKAEAADERAAKKIAADAADRFRDVLSECLGHEDENPGDDVLVAELREHFGRTGPEPTRWREFCSGALAVVDQLNAERADSLAAQSAPEAATVEEDTATCGWCGEPASNCPNRDGECCCLPCFYRGPGHAATGGSHDRC